MSAELKKSVGNLLINTMIDIIKIKNQIEILSAGARIEKSNKEKLGAIQSELNSIINKISRRNYQLSSL